MSKISSEGEEISDTMNTTTIPIVIVEIDGEELEYTQTEVDDGTVERDMERNQNLEDYGCELTDEQIERGDCDFEIYEEEIYEEEIYEDEVLIHAGNTDEHTGEEVLILDEEIIYIEDLTEEEIEELEELIELEAEILEKELLLIEEQEEFLEDIGLILTDEELENLTEEEILEKVPKKKDFRKFSIKLPRPPKK